MAGQVEIRPFAETDAEPLIASLRDIDAFEWTVTRETRPNEIDVCRFAKRSRYASTLWYEGEIIAVGGMYQRAIVGGATSPWMLATKALERPDVQRAFARKVLRMAPVVLTGGAYGNIVAARNTLAIRLLKRIGFDVDQKPVIVNGVEFLAFTMEV